MNVLCNVFLLCVFLLVTPSRSLNLRAHDQPLLRSKKSPSETISIYEVVDPVVSFGVERTNQGHPKDIRVSLQSEEETYQVYLQLNEFLLSPSFTSGYQINGKKLTEGHDNCFYHGKVVGHEDWSAAFSTCYGLRGWFGDIHDPSNLYHLEPIEDTSSLTSPHALYSDSQHQNNKQGTCGTNGGHAVDDLSHLDSHDHHTLSKRQVSETLIVEWLLVNDYHQYMNYNQNISAVAHRAIEIANHVDLLYQALNIRIVLVHSVTWTNRQLIADTTDADTLLDLFEDYHRVDTGLMEIVHDSAMLITGIEIAGSTVGVAFLNRMCVYDQSVGFTQDTGSSINSVGGIAAHELGHIFNMQHDDAEGCQCPDDNGCIMNAQLGFPAPTQFSQCSRNQLDEGIEDFGGGVCLDNDPTMIFGDPACGNGIKEPGEVCDCGSLEECRDPCCNATTCTLSEGSDCADGPCCSSCQFVAYGTTCRERRGECGITEYCSGSSAECPRDVYIQNGFSCENNNSFCYDGICASLSSECVRYYGEESVPAVEECYEDLNAQGEPYGHCGAANNVFLPCSPANARCGSIHCSGGQIIFNNIEFTGTITSYTRSVSVEGGFAQCKTFSTAANSDQISPGLVMEGTKCGEEQLCISQECVSIASLGVTPCAVGSNGRVCSGNGICNNLNECSCLVGWNGTDCGREASSRTSGGGGGGGSAGSTGAIVGGVVGGILVLIVLAIAIIAVIVLVVVFINKSDSKPISPARRFGQRNSADRGKGSGVHGSTDDLLMTGLRNDNKTPSPIPPVGNVAGPISYKPYTPPTYSPSSSPSITVNRRPPPQAPQSHNNYVNQPRVTPRPPPPSVKPPVFSSPQPSAPTMPGSRPIPPVNRPTPPINRPTPPVNKPIPPVNRPSPLVNKPILPTNKPGQSTAKPIPAVRTNVPPKAPHTAPKPSKIAVAWPPPSDSSSASKPVVPIPPKKPIVPRK